MNPNDLVQISTSTSDAVKGCSYIYAPAGQAGEYAPLAANPYRGCGHGCSYCYVPLVLKMKRDEFDAGATARPDYLVKLEKDAKKYQAAGIAEQVFFSFTTDVYSPFDTSLTRPSLQIVQNHGMGVCVLTKGGSRALADIDVYRSDRDCFASTLTSLDDAFSKKWERNAALPDDRIATLKKFHDRGIFTWVSLEPTLSVEASLAIVEATHEFVDLFKVGRANYLGEYSKNINWEEYTHRMIDLCGNLGVAHYIKKDLQPYLPAGYNNPLRVKQHHGPAEPVTEKISQNLPPSGGELATTVAISPASQGDFQQIISEDATEALAEYEALDMDINERTANWKTRFADVMAEFGEEILPLLEQMNSLLSHHGLRHTPGLPGWAAWFEKYRRSINLKMTMRTVQRKLKRLRGEEPDLEHCESDGNSAEEEKDEIQALPLVIESPRELLSKRLKELHTTLSGKSAKSDTMRLERALELVEDTQLAIEEGLFGEVAPAIAAAAADIPTGQIPEPAPFTEGEISEALDWLEGELTKHIEPDEEDYVQAMCLRWLAKQFREQLMRVGTQQAPSM